MRNTCLAAAFTATAGTAAFADCGQVQMAGFGWQSAQVSSAITTFILEQGYGCTVEKVPTGTTAAFMSLVENGTPHFLMNIWSNSVAAREELRDEGKVVFAGKLLKEGGLQG